MANVLTNVWKYTIFLITNKRVWVAIIAVYYLTIPGVNELGISYIILAGNIAGIIFEIPSGYLADIIGHKKTLIISRVFAILSTLFYLVSWDIWSLIIASIFLSMSVAFTSGTGNAFMQDTLRAAGREKDYARIMGKVKALGFSIPLIISTIVPFFAGISMRAPFVVGLVMDIIGFVIALTFVTPKVVQNPIKKPSISNFVSVFQDGRKSGFLKYAVYTGVLGGLIFAIGNYRGPYQASAGAIVAYFGLFFGAGRLFASIMLWFSGSIQKRFTMKQFFLLQSVLYGLIFLVLGLSNNAWLIVILFAIQNGLKWGLTEIEDSYFIDLIKGSSFKATLLSIGAQTGQFIGALAALLVGAIITYFGYKQGFLVFSLVFSIIMSFMYLVTFTKVPKVILLPEDTKQ